MRTACPTPDSNRSRRGRIHHTSTGTATATDRELQGHGYGQSSPCVLDQTLNTNSSARSDNASCYLQPSYTLPLNSPSPSLSSSSPSHSIPPLPPLTPTSSRASILTPTSRHRHKHRKLHSSSSSSLYSTNNQTSLPPTPLRKQFLVKPTLSLTVDLKPVPLFHTMTAAIARPVSPPPRPMSPSTRPDLINRPSSRCESLLRDTLRRAEEYERTQSVSRARSKSRPRARPRGNSLLGQLQQDDEAEDERDNDADTRSSTSSSFANRRGSYEFFRAQQPPISAPRAFKAAFVGSPPEVDHFPYGSPSSPSPMPPPLHRTRTAPQVPLASGSNVLLEVPHPDHMRPMPNSSRTAPQSPRASRQPLPNTASTARRTSSAGPQSPTVADNAEASPGSRGYVLSPHEAVLRAKLESVLHRNAPHVLETRLEERGNVEQKANGFPPRSSRQRNHVRSQSQIVVPGQRCYGEREHGAGLSLTPNALASHGMSASGTDLARLQTSTPGYRQMLYNRDSDNSPSSEPSEPMTPPPTPPFNARMASEVCKRMEGYVSFANVEGLGEPAGLDMDESATTSEESQGKWGRFLRVWPFNSHHSNGGGEHQDAGAYLTRREVSMTRG